MRRRRSTRVQAAPAYHGGHAGGGERGAVGVQARLQVGPRLAAAAGVERHAQSEAITLRGTARHTERSAGQAQAAGFERRGGALERTNANDSRVRIRQWALQLQRQWVDI